jgi:hypothetical protein
MVDLNVKLEMTTYKSEQDLAQAQAATAKVIEFYTLPPEMQARVAPLYRQMLKAFQVNGVDEIIQPGFQIPPTSTSGGNPDPQMMKNSGAPSQQPPVV